MMRFLRYIAEAIAAMVGIGILLTFALIWRLSVQPVSSNFMTPYIEGGIETIVPGSQVTVGDSLLVWDNTERSISLRVDQIKINDAGGHVIADVPTLRAAVSVVGLVFGQFMPRDVLIDHPQLHLERDAHGAYVFGGMPMASTAPSPPQNVDSLKDIIQNAFAVLNHAALMHKLAVEGAVLTVHDRATQKDWMISVPEISIKRNGLNTQVGKLPVNALEGRITVEVTQKDGIARLDLNYGYDRQNHQHHLSTVFDGLNSAYLASGHPETLGLSWMSITDLPLTGKIDLFLDKDLSFDTIDAQIHGDAGQFAYAPFWENPLTVKSFDVNTHFDRQAHHLDITDTHLDLGDADIDLSLSGAPTTVVGQDLDWTADIKVDGLPMNRLDAVWPKAVLPDPRAWLTSNLHDGVFKHAQAHLLGTVNWSDIANLSVNDGGGQVVANNARVGYLAGMPPAEGVNAVATFDLKKMLVQVNGGGLGAIRMQPFTVEITGLADNDQYIHIPLRLAAPVPDVLRLLDHPPLGYAKALGITPDDVQGKIEGSVDFRFPLLNALLVKDVQLNATATATGVATSKMIPQINVDQGNLGLTLDMNGFVIKGQVGLNTLPFQLAWQENFESKAGAPLRKINVSGVIRDNQWNNLGIKAFDGSKGAMSVALEVKKPDKKKTTFSGNIDFTPAATQVDLLGWKKPANIPAVFHFTATALQDAPVQINSFELRGDHVHVQGDALLSDDLSRLLSLNASPYVLGRSDAMLNISRQVGTEGTLHIDVTGAALDISGVSNDKAEAQKDQQDQEVKTYHINVDKLYTSADGEIDHAQGNASEDAQGWRSINFHGLADGDMPLAVELTPWPDNHRTFLVACDDFGKMMKGLGITDTIKGGKVNVTGESTPDNPRVIDGHAKISSFTVEKLPALALLLNATSPFGFVDILTDSADFSRLESRFRWQGDTLTLSETHAAGSAMGININGKVDLNSGHANLQGTLVPFSVVNSVLNSIPLIGDLITGGKNQGVLAVSYQIKGNLSSPEISVNPVSLLTPGFIRNLFFGDDE